MSASGRSRRADRRRPRRISAAVGAVVAHSEPKTLLAEAQREWPAACGAALAARSEPVSERRGTLTIACDSAVLAQEIELLAPEIIGRLNGLLERGEVAALRPRSGAIARESGESP